MCVGVVVFYNCVWVDSMSVVSSVSVVFAVTAYSACIHMGMG